MFRQRLGPWFVLILTIFITSTAFATSELLNAVLALQNDARSLNANKLAPRAYSEAEDALTYAQKLIDRGKGADAISEQLEKASTSFQAAIDHVEVARQSLSKAFSARDRALAVDAAKFNPKDWDAAEAKFEDAVSSLEKGNESYAKRLAATAEKAFQDVELAAIKATYLNDVKQDLDKADNDRIDREAPKTLALAKTLLKTAEDKLNTDRYDTEQPKQLSQQSRTALEHARTIAEEIRAIDETNMSMEDFILRQEQHVTTAAKVLDFEPPFEKGMKDATQALADRIEEYISGMDDQVKALQERIATLNSQLEGKDKEIASLEESVKVMKGTIQELQSEAGKQIAALEEKLGGAEEKKAEMEAKMAKQRQMKENFEKVKGMFEESEALVSKVNESVVIDAFGLNFASGKATIEPQFFGLLSRIQRSIDLYPRCMLQIEGHTDSFGSDEKNLELSKQRAENVLQYIVSNMGMNAERASAQGYGETRPMSSNDTKEGREMNRRITVVIQPEGTTPAADARSPRKSEE